MLLATVAGYVGQDPEHNTTKSGVSVCNFTIAHSVPKSDETVWVKVTAWRGLADIFVKHVHKGDFLTLVGDLEVETYKNREGEFVAQPKITVQSFTFGPSKKGGETDPDEIDF